VVSDGVGVATATGVAFWKSRSEAMSDME
jgi:hypothetical protein